MFFVRLYRVLPMIAVLAVAAGIVYAIALVLTSPPRAKEIVIKCFLVLCGILCVGFGLASAYALFEGNSDVFELMICFFATAVVGLLVTLLCRAIFLKHNPAYRTKATKAHVMRHWPWSK